MFSMFGRTGAPQKRPPQEDGHFFPSEINKSDSDNLKKVASLFSGKIGVTPLGAAPGEGPTHFFSEQGPA